MNYNNARKYEEEHKEGFINRLRYLIFRSIKSMSFLNYKDISIGYKYLVALLAMVLLFSVSALIVKEEVDKTDKTVMHLGQLSNQTVAITEMGALFREKTSKAVNYAGLKNSAYIAQAEYSQIQEKFDNILDQLKLELVEQNQLAIFEEVSSIDNQFNDVFTKEILTSVQNNDQDNLYWSVTRANELSNKMVETLNQLRQTVEYEQRQATIEMEGSFKIVIQSLLIGLVIAIIVSIIVLYFTNRNIQKRLKSLVQFSEAISRGELIKEIEHIGGKDEVGILGKAMQDMKNNLIDIIEEIATVGKQVNEKGRGIYAETLDVEEHAVRINQSMEELSRGSDHQATTIMDIANMIEDWVEDTHHANKIAETIDANTKEVEGYSQSGSRNIELSVNQMIKIDEMMHQSMIQLEGFNDKTNKVNKMIDLIQEVSAQTNLLALNATIEAARAGNHGSGFAVVANEVKKLAGQVKDLSSEIDTIIQEITYESDQVYQLLHEGYSEVSAGLTQIQKTQNSFVEIDQSILRVSESMSKIVETLGQLLMRGEIMKNSTQDVAAVAEEQAASVESTSEGMDAITNAIKSIKLKTKGLDENASRSEKLVKQFKM